MDWLKTTGRLVYDPERFDFKKTHRQRTLIAELPWDDLDLYYQWFLRKQKGTWFDNIQRVQTCFVRDRKTSLFVWGSTQQINSNIPCVNRPMWGRHVTIVGGNEQGYKSENWGKHQGAQIEILFSPNLDCKWKFWYLPVCGDNLFEFRTELGLQASHNFHITIAREI